MHTNRRVSRRAKLGAAALLAASVFVVSVTPSTADMWSPQRTTQEGGSSAFHRHFYRGTQRSHAQNSSRADMMAFANEAEPTDEAMSYCTRRFKSYDPATGTYLGYDGNEHPCP